MTVDSFRFREEFNRFLRSTGHQYKLSYAATHSGMDFCFRFVNADKIDEDILLLKWSIFVDRINKIDSGDCTLISSEDIRIVGSFLDFNASISNLFLSVSGMTYRFPEEVSA